MFSAARFSFFWSLFSYALRGRLSYRGGHRPPTGHVVPKSFAGVSVAASVDPAVDNYIVERLHEAGICSLRLDFTYGDADGPAARLLERLCSEPFQIMLHLVQPRDAAQSMEHRTTRTVWRSFVAETLDRFGEHIVAVEIGSTVNRKRWAGYTLRGFLSAWEIAHQEVRARGIKLAGPSVTDFEPPFNIGLLALLRQRQQLPDIHTNNLFAERCTEPERYDHKVLGRQLGAFARLNLVKKALLLKRIGADFGVPKLLSPAAFWTLPRIERLLPDSEQKQADYLTRYMVLCAASGALEGAWWGPLICHREGLIDDGQTHYPALERITHYASVSGGINDFRVRAAFRALQTFATMIPGCRYEGRLTFAQELEIHAFRSSTALIHVAWTVNARAAAVSDVYTSEDMQSATWLSRDGQSLTERPTLLTEAPTYLLWTADKTVAVNPDARILSDVVIHRHIAGKTHFLFREDGWQGILLARDKNEAELLLGKIHPARVGVPSTDTILRHARNAIWTIDDPRAAHARLVAKRPVKMHLHKKLLDRFKPSKGLRSWNGTCELLRRGVSAATPVAYFEKTDGSDLTENLFLCEFLAAKKSAREMVSTFARGLPEFCGVSEDNAWRQLCSFLLRMHGRGIHFRDLSGGNILICDVHEGQYDFSLIDTGRIHASDSSLTVCNRLSDLVRVCNKMSSQGRSKFMTMYMGGINRKFGGTLLVPFILYDIKVELKRLVGRKAISKLFRRHRA